MKNSDVSQSGREFDARASYDPSLVSAGKGRALLREQAWAELEGQVAAVNAGLRPGYIMSATPTFKGIGVTLRLPPRK